MTNYQNNYAYTMRTGNLTKDPEIREFTDAASGEIRKVVNLHFAHNYTTDGGNDAVSFFDVALWRKDAETAEALIKAGKLRKGSLVMVHGRETTKVRNYQGKKYVNKAFENALVSVWDRTVPGERGTGAWAEVTVRAKAESEQAIQAVAESGITA